MKKILSMLGYLPRILTVFIFSLAIGAPTAKSAAAAAVQTWTYCANEYATTPTCMFSGTRQVRYGANATYYYQTATGSIACSNAAFGDPIPVQKTCDYSNDEVAMPGATWINCASESAANPLCSFSATRQVRFGANGSYNYKTATGSIACTSAVFGDPAPGVLKTCDYSSLQSDSTPPAPQPGAVLPIPTNVANGATVDLQCGKIYQGTLELNGKSNITVHTVGTCGKASITPASVISGWTQYLGNIYSAPIAFTPAQVSVAGNPIDAAHWPSGAQIWVTDSSSPPNSDVNGATRVYKDNQSVILTQTISGTTFDTTKPYYVEGKLWMLDSPGEWVFSNGRLYVWAPDGLSPEGRVWAAPTGSTGINGINADKSTNITIDGVQIFSAADGISGDTSTNLKVQNSDITNSSRDGIWASGSTGLMVDKTTVTNSVRNGIDGWYWVVGAVVTNSTVTNTGTVGRPKPTDAGIMFGDGKGNRIENARVINSGYHGISVLHNVVRPADPAVPGSVETPTKVLSSLVDTACVQLTDCGGIYTGSRDKVSLGMTINGNNVTNVKGTYGVAIYLDDFANGVSVGNNGISNSTKGMLIHNGFNNVMQDNVFGSNAVTHLNFGQDATAANAIYGNVVKYNTIKSTSGEQTYNLEGGPNLLTFATFDYNTYTSTNVNIFARTWDGGPQGFTRSYTDWKVWSGMDANSTMNGAP